MSEKNGSDKRADEEQSVALVPAGMQGLSATEFEPRSLPELAEMAKWLSTSSLVPAELKSKPADVMVMIMFGREHGLGVMQSLRSIYVVKGRPAMSAALMEGLCRVSPLCKKWKRLELDGTHCTISVQRSDDDGPTLIEFTMEDAKVAGLLASDGWKKYPKRMLLARARSDAAREMFPEIMNGVYSSEERRDQIEAEPIAAQTFAPPPVMDAQASTPPPVQAVDIAPESSRAPGATEEPPHDPDTGEVTAPLLREPGCDDGPTDDVTTLGEALAAAPTQALLDAVAARIGSGASVGALSDLDVGVLRAAYRKRQEEITGAAK